MLVSCGCDCGDGGGGAIEKWERPLKELLVLPHGFEVTEDDPAGLFQSSPGLDAVYDGVIGDRMLFRPIPIAGLACCCVLIGAIAGNPVLGAMAGKELSELSVLSGVIVLLVVRGAERFVACGEIGGVDHENAGPEEAVLDAVRFPAGRDGNIIEDVAVEDALPQGSPPSIFPPPLV